MKCLVISDNFVEVSGFRKMGVEAVLADSEDKAISEVDSAITSRKVGTLILSPSVQRIAKSVLEAHQKSGRLPFVMTLNG